jgi:2'-5' RNA ligase
MTSYGIMRYCIYLTFDPQTHLVLQKLQGKLAVHAQAYNMAGKLGPHLSLLVFDDANLDSVLMRFERVADSLPGFSVQLNGTGIFPGRRSVVFVSPLPSHILMNSYLRCLDTFSGSVIVPQYRAPDKWKPHITLAKGMDSRISQEILAFAERGWTPCTADIAGIGLINVQKPLEVLASRSLVSVS